jgi:cytochrome c oxidase assembly protein subunit 15
MQIAVNEYPRYIKFWLMTGVVMVFMQGVIGGITRLTDSGLSITEWAVIQGTIPPLNADAWEIARQEYMQHAIGQVNMKWPASVYPQGIPMDEFKFIYFWEYFHRLWARTMGFVFLIPFLIFLYLKKLSKALIIQLLKVVSLTSLVAVFGWIMVKSGLDTPELAWVNGYKLTIHLSLATMVFSYLWWVCLGVIQPQTQDGHNKRLRKFAGRITLIVCLQIVLGGLMAGIKAGLLFNHFPHMEVDYSDQSWIWIADVLKDQSMWTWENMRNYNASDGFAAAFIQLLHRGTAYLLCILIPLLFLNIKRIHHSKQLTIGAYSMLFILIFQVVLGILTLLNGVGQIPLFFGVLHQAFGLLLLASMLYIVYQFGSGGHQVKLQTSKQESV